VVYAPTQEDFGLVGAEALMAGKPLIGVNEGFTRYQVEEGVTGRLFDPEVADLRETIQSFDTNIFNRDDIQEFAERYDYTNFEEGLRKVVFKQV
ncbi:glycosyltransferase, partial [Halorubrum sp. SP9]|uniref:glycosyltransferase n=3 Tax=Halorubrum TaxID=56688 RepID=UPI0018EECA8D